MPEILIETKGLTKVFGSFTAVADVDLSVGSGEVLVLLGPNGAGKTTTTRMLASILQPTSGSARIAGYDAIRQPVEVRRHVGLLTEHHGLYTRMRAGEYLAFFARIYGLTRGQSEVRVRRLLDEVGLQDMYGRRLGEFSKGMRQKLALVRALLPDPPVLLLDEPTSAMDPASARLVRENIGRLRSANRAVVVTTHNLAEAELLADRIAIICRGRIAALGTVDALKRAYLGSPIMELRLSGRMDGAAQLLPDGLRPIASGPDWLRYQSDVPQETNPRLLRALSAAGLEVVTLSEVARSLEEIYMRVIGAAAPEAEG